MAEHPILFSAPMVRAILAGKKTQTRRAVRPSTGRQSEWLTPELIGKVPHGEIQAGGWQMHHPKAGTHFAGVFVEHDSPLGWVKCPYGDVGDELWVREAWQHEDGSCDSARCGQPTHIYYRATEGYPESMRWRTPLHMPRWASRLSLRVTEVRVQRLQEITMEDAEAEGVSRFEDGYGVQGWDFRSSTSLGAFLIGWDTINGKRAPWASNPWVWAITFERKEPR